MFSIYQAEAEKIILQLLKNPKIVVIGSTYFWGEDSDELCSAIGEALAEIDGLVLLTGGVTGVGETVGRSFYRIRSKVSPIPEVYHILPRGMIKWDYGTTLYAGDTMQARREILGRLAKLYLSVEGGPGTAHEAEVAIANGAFVIPIARTGGFSADLFKKIKCPVGQLEDDWKLLNNANISHSELVNALINIIEFLITQY